jgi:Fe-Mn family superoxide dismutase
VEVVEDGAGVDAAGSAAEQPLPSKAQPRVVHRQSLAPGVDRPIPVAVLSLYEHAYVGEKYGVWGRGQYAKDWFRRLNWEKVQQRAAYVP